MKSLQNHPNYSDSDYNYLKAKGYGDAEIIAIWERDRKQGNTSPLIHKPIPNIIGSLKN